MKKKFMCMLMAAAMTLSMAACGSKGDDANNDANAGGSSDGVQTFTVGTSGPLTGDNAIYGVAVKQGVELAINEINASDSTIKFKFLSQDDEADGEKAVNAYNNMMDNGMQVLVRFLHRRHRGQGQCLPGLLHRPQPGRWRCRLHG